jgi:hypothetical protein
MVYVTDEKPASAGWVTYFADWTEPAPGPHANISSAAALPEGSAATGTMDELQNWAEVYSHTVAPGEGLHLLLTMSGDGDADLAVYGIGATDIYAADPVAGAWRGVDLPESFMCRAPMGGVCFPTVWSWRGDAVPYSLEHTVTPPTDLTATRSASTVSYGSYVRISGLLAENGGPLGNQEIVLQSLQTESRHIGWTESTGPGTWPPNITGSGAPYDPGTFVFVRYPTANTRFAVEYPGLWWAHTPALSNDVDVYVRAWMPTPGKPSTVYHGRAFTSYGYIKPKHSAGSYPVQLIFEHLHSGKVVYTKKVNARASNYSSYTKYSASVNLPYAGAWRFRAYHKGDSITAKNGSAATYSAYKSFTAK